MPDAVPATRLMCPVVAVLVSKTSPAVEVTVTPVRPVSFRGTPAAVCSTPVAICTPAVSARTTLPPEPTV